MPGQALITAPLQEWHATAETLANPAFMPAYRQPDEPRADVPGNRCVAHSTYRVILKCDARNALRVIPRHIAEHTRQFSGEHPYHQLTHGGNADPCP
jgi:hypothetical protein